MPGLMINPRPNASNTTPQQPFRPSNGALFSTGSGHQVAAQCLQRTAPVMAPGSIPVRSSGMLSRTTLPLVCSTLQAACIQRRNDAQLGKPVLQGAEEYRKLIGWMVQQLSTNGTSSSPSFANSAQQLGALGQQYLVSQFQSELMSAISTPAGETAAAATGTGAAGAAEATSLAGQLLGAAGAAYSVYSLIDSWGQSSPAIGAAQGMAAGAYIGSSILPGVGTVVGGALGAAAGALIGLVHNGKHKDQIARDGMRAMLQKIGFVDGDFNLRLADGSPYNIGKDGGFKLLSTDGTERRAYETDMSNPLTGQVIAWVDPLAAALANGDPKLKTDLAGYLTNAATSNAEDLEVARANVLNYYLQLGAAPEKVLEANVELSSNGRGDSGVLAAYANSLQTLFADVGQ